ncbi:MAG: hypothetical protein ABGY24_12045 [bacterium]
MSGFLRKLVTLSRAAHRAAGDRGDTRAIVREGWVDGWMDGWASGWMKTYLIYVS